MSTDRIEKQIQLNAPQSRVWRALTDHKEFGEWFGVALDAPFAVGHEATGHMTNKGYEHVQWHSVVEEISPETLFSFTWHPYGIDPNIDYTKEKPTLVEFRLEPRDGGTFLTVAESGFDSVPASRREEAFRMNEKGWASQMTRIEKYVAANP